MKRKVYSITLFLFLSFFVHAQQRIGNVKGTVTEKDDAGDILPLIGANVYWNGTVQGTVTDESGTFSIEKIDDTSILIISYIGYQNDTIDVADKNYIEVNLKASVSIDEVEIAYRRKSTEISRLDPLKVEKIGEKELLKAACCNLSESFETSPGVDVSFTDAITGTRQIQMLGLAGPYTQITRENMPDVRGLSALYGLTYIPGTWVESIQLNKGTGTVINGYESIAGQINTELRKPESADRLYLNVYGNESGRMEGNANIAHVFKQDNLSTALLLHGKTSSIKHDRNNDGFLDHPLGNQFIGLNRWKYYGEKGIRAQLGLKATRIDNTGGQLDFDPTRESTNSTGWGMHLITERYEGWAKIGKTYEEMPWKTIGLQLSGASHTQESYFGLNNYDARQNTLYINSIYQDIFSNTNHTFRTGASFQYDDFIEELNDTVFKRTEFTPGIYFEYTFTHVEKFSAVAGIRTDYHNLYGLFVTPRLHVRYAIAENTILRASGGRGLRTASIISENSGLLASSRDIIILGNDNKNPYGLKPEIAWNTGVNLTQYFTLDYRDGTISFDFYHTNFINQVVVDHDQRPWATVFYNLDGRSYSNSFQAQLDYELIKRLDFRLAYRMFDVKTTYNGKLMQKPLIAKHRAFVNIAYQTRKYWRFDITANWQGEKRIPSTNSNPETYQLPGYSPDYVLMNAQISKEWREKFEIYAGVENLLDYKQEKPILSSEDPFSPYFDSSLIWGPIFGRNTYVGLRYYLK